MDVACSAFDANERLKYHVEKHTVFSDGDAPAEKAVSNVRSSL
jgi:hypothetical protein